jgi:cystathionine gamma-synthase
VQFETRAIHVGQDPEPTTGAVTVPIFQTSTFAQPKVGEHLGYEYARTGNPTRTALQTCLASLEGTEAAVCFASGLAAEDAVFRLLSPGDHVVMANDVYGGTWRQIAQVHARFGIEVSAVDLTDLDAVRAAIRPTTRYVWAETPSNPLLKILDLAALAELAHEHDAWLVADNTFATPYLQRPSSSAPTSSCTRPPSTSAGTPTWSAARCAPTPRPPPSSPSCRTPSARCRARSTRG